jgi:hypothetical protein
MGGFVAVSCAARYPERIGRVVLVDGGLLLGVEALAASTVDDVLHAVLGPALGRLRRTFTNRASYHQFGREHPAFHDPDIWTPEVEAYLDNELVGEPPLLRPGVSLEAVHRDSQDTLGDSARHALERVDRPLELLRAPSGIFGEPTGLYPRMSWPPPRQYVRIDHHEVVEDTNHYSIVLGARGRRRSPRTAADGSRSSAPPAGSWRAGRCHASHSNAWRQTRLLRRVPANAEAEQVPQAHDPNQRGPRNDGKMAEPAAEHDLGRSLRVDMGPDGLRVACHPPGYW